MSAKLLGAICILCSCGGCGLLMAKQHLRCLRLLRNFADILEYMECELQYRCTPLPQLCRQVALSGNGKIFHLLHDLSLELDAQICPNVELCMVAALEQHKDLPGCVVYLFTQLGRSLGRFDLDGQLTGLCSLGSECQRKLEELDRTKDARTRSYQTLGLCAGAALAILFV